MSTAANPPENDSPLRIFLIGSSRGLGAATAVELRREKPAAAMCLMARKRPLLEAVQKQLGQAVEIAAFDISRERDQLQALEVIAGFKPTHIWSFIGGGPHGLYESKDFKDHLWAWNVSFLFNARLLHAVLRDSKHYPQVRQLLFVGSGVAESQADPLAASYAAGKHALKGLVTSVQTESPGFDVRLASPGYMNTELLPADAWPRTQCQVSEPEVIARAIVNWAFTAHKENAVAHLRL